MYFNQFQKQLSKSLSESEIVRQTQYFGKLIQEAEDGSILVDRVLTCFLSLEEAKQSIKYTKIKEDIEHHIHSELYENISDTKIAEIIHEHHDVKVTDKLVESYIELASSKTFTLDPVVYDIRNYNTSDRIIESKLDFKLDDGSHVMIDDNTYNRINKVFAEHVEVIHHMRQSADNFLSVVNMLEEY